jgi:hypothetical protein
MTNLFLHFFVWKINQFSDFLNIFRVKDLFWNNLKHLINDLESLNHDTGVIRWLCESDELQLLLLEEPGQLLDTVSLLILDQDLTENAKS